MNLVMLDTLIRQDKEGRYSLNDLHAAAIKNGNATASHAPAQFLRNDSVKAFISELDSDVQFCTSVVAYRGGRGGIVGMIV